MSGMTGYETGTAYSAPQYAGYEGDPRQAAGWGHPAQYGGHPQVAGGSPAEQRYAYYDNRCCTLTVMCNT